MAECDGRVVGFARYDQQASHYHPRKFHLEVVVDPALFQRGIGRRLYDLVLAEVAGLKPTTVDAWSREDMACRVGFLARRGFVEDMRLWTSVLDLTTFDSSRFAHLAPAVEAQGMTEVSFDRFLRNHDRPTLLPPGFFVALDGEQYVATSHLWLSPEADLLRTGGTGVRRAYRRRGIAFALKVRSLEFAQAHGYRRVQTENESNNRGMLAINDQLGFARNPAWVHYLKSIQD